MSDRQRPSIYTVAEHAGVSIATVSRVLQDSSKVAAPTRQRVLATIGELGWQPSRLARGLAGKAHGAVGIVFPDLLGIYYAQVLLGYEGQALRDDRSVLILATHGRAGADAMVSDLAERVDGLVVMDRTVSDETVQRLDERVAPVVLLARPDVGHVPNVRVENTDSSRAVTDHLLGHGHSRIAFLGDPAAAPDVQERWDGFRAAHRAAGVAPSGKAVPAGFLQDDGHEAAITMLASPSPPTAFMCANDALALGVYAAAREAGVPLPGGLAVTGWDDIPAARAVSPQLTTVHQPMRTLGERAGALLSQRIRGAQVSSERLPTRLVLRRSCGCG